MALKFLISNSSKNLKKKKSRGKKTKQILSGKWDWGERKRGRNDE